MFSLYRHKQEKPESLFDFQKVLDEKGRCLSVLNINNMIPVPETELELYDIENETDAVYKDLVQNEIIYIRSGVD